MAICFLDTAAGYLEIVRVQFNPDAFAAKFGAGDERGAAAHEWVKDGQVRREEV